MEKIYAINEYGELVHLEVLKETKKTFLVKEHIKFNKTVLNKEKDTIFEEYSKGKEYLINYYKNIIQESKKTLREADAALKKLL